MSAVGVTPNHNMSVTAPLSRQIYYSKKQQSSRPETIGTETESIKSNKNIQKTPLRSLCLHDFVSYYG